MPEIINLARRAALYIRVSTEEQAKHGYSLEAQEKKLKAYSKEHGYKVAGIYIDEGKSARKAYTKRPEFMRMMDDVKADKIDVILFIKLDRWFRNIYDYYKIQEILDAHGVQWKTTEEHYDTETTNGRLHINIRLSVAQDECDRDSDRIKFVVNRKIERGEVVSGRVPKGFRIENKHLVLDPEMAPKMLDMFEYYDTHENLNGTSSYMRETYGISIHPNDIKQMLRNEKYKGKCRDNENWCPQLVPPEMWDRIQIKLGKRSVRNNQTGRIYLFSGLVRCAECGGLMTGVHASSSSYGENLYYRDKNATVMKRCVHTKMMPERKLEAWLLANLEGQISETERAWKIEHQQKKRKPKLDRAAVLRKLDRLKDLYLDDLITKEQYRADLEKYQAQLAQEDGPEERPPDFSALRSILDSGFNQMYQALDRKGRQDFWRGVIKTINIDADNIPHLILK
jgi:Site-specific recombinases, DNA invertase Pin homologs